jgi:hypothetical protein
MCGGGKAAKIAGVGRQGDAATESGSFEESGILLDESLSHWPVFHVELVNELCEQPMQTLTLGADSLFDLCRMVLLFLLELLCQIFVQGV